MLNANIINSWTPSDCQNIIQEASNTLGGISQIMNINEPQYVIDTVSSQLQTEKLDYATLMQKYFNQTNNSNASASQLSLNYHVHIQTYPTSSKLYRNELSDINQPYKKNATSQEMLSLLQKTYPIKIPSIMTDLKVSRARFLSLQEAQINSTMLIQFGQISDEEKLKCIQRQNDGKWVSDNCKTIVQVINNQKQIFCSCNKPEKTSLIADIDQLFNNKNAQDIFNGNGAQRIMELSNWYKYASIWTIICLNLFLIIIMIVGHKLDKRDTHNFLNTKLGQVDQNTNTYLSEKNSKNQSLFMKIKINNRAESQSQEGTPRNQLLKTESIENQNNIIKSKKSYFSQFQANDDQKSPKNTNYEKRDDLNEIKDNQQTKYQKLCTLDTPQSQMTNTLKIKNQDQFQILNSLNTNNIVETQQSENDDFNLNNDYIKGDSDQNTPKTSNNQMRDDIQQIQVSRKTQYQQLITLDTPQTQITNKNNIKIDNWDQVQILNNHNLNQKQQTQHEALNNDQIEANNNQNSSNISKNQKKDCINLINYNQQTNQIQTQEKEGQKLNLSNEYVKDDDNQNSQKMNCQKDDDINQIKDNYQTEQLQSISQDILQQQITDTNNLQIDNWDQLEILNSLNFNNLIETQQNEHKAQNLNNDQDQVDDNQNSPKTSYEKSDDISQIQSNQQIKQQYLNISDTPTPLISNTENTKIKYKEQNEFFKKSILVETQIEEKTQNLKNDYANEDDNQNSPQSNYEKRDDINQINENEQIKHQQLIISDTQQSQITKTNKIQIENWDQLNMLNSLNFNNPIDTEQNEDSLSDLNKNYVKVDDNQNILKADCEKRDDINQFNENQQIKYQQLITGDTPQSQITSTNNANVEIWDQLDILNSSNFNNLIQAQQNDQNLNNSYVKEDDNQNFPKTNCEKDDQNNQIKENIQTNQLQLINRDITQSQITDTNNAQMENRDQLEIFNISYSNNQIETQQNEEKTSNLNNDQLKIDDNQNTLKTDSEKGDDINQINDNQQTKHQQLITSDTPQSQIPNTNNTKIEIWNYNQQNLNSSLNINIPTESQRSDDDIQIFNKYSKINQNYNNNYEETKSEKLDIDNKNQGQYADDFNQISPTNKDQNELTFSCTIKIQNFKETQNQQIDANHLINDKIQIFPGQPSLYSKQKSTILQNIQNEEIQKSPLSSFSPASLISKQSDLQIKTFNSQVEQVQLDNKSEEMSNSQINEKQLKKYQEKIKLRKAKEKLLEYLLSENKVKGTLVFHSLFSALIVYDEKFSRLIKLIIYYNKIVLLLAINSIFKINLNAVQVIILSIVSKITLHIVTAIITCLLSNILVVISGQDPYEANIWIKSYFLTLIINEYLIGLPICYAMYSISKKFLNKVENSAILLILGADSLIEAFKS
ncbi:hypothetical protein ABPG73_019344 [Tetrahymena malaccensis]